VNRARVVKVDLISPLARERNLPSCPSGIFLITRPIRTLGGGTGGRTIRGSDEPPYRGSNLLRYNYSLASPSKSPIPPNRRPLSRIHVIHGGADLRSDKGGEALRPRDKGSCLIGIELSDPQRRSSDARGQDGGPICRLGLTYQSMR